MKKSTENKESTDNKESEPQIISKFQLVIAAAKRSKQIIQIAKKRGITPNQVALVESKSIKPTTLAVEEFRANQVHCVVDEKQENLPSEEQPIQSESSAESEDIKEAT